MGNKILTAFNFDCTQLAVHWEVLQVHRAASRDCQSAEKNKKEKQIRAMRMKRKGLEYGEQIGVRERERERERRQCLFSNFL